MLKYLEIEQVINKLLPLIEKYNNGSINYQIEQLKVGLEIINSDIPELEKDRALFSLRKNLFPLHGGLTDFNVWVEDGKKRIDINKPIGDLSDKLWMLLR